MKIICIVSGGMDSVTLLNYLKKENSEIKGLTFCYNQKHKKEIDYAQRACEKLRIDWNLVDISNILPFISNSALTGDIEIPEGHYQQENMKLTVVPNRNMIMLSIAIGYAENLKYEGVAYAAHQGDHFIYPDCRPEFATALSLASQLGTFNKIQLITPFMNLHKGQIAKIGLDLGINYDEQTWTCYKGLDNPCSKCGACVERKEAIEYARSQTTG